MKKRSSFTEADYRSLAEQIRRQILERYTVDSCIATTAATVDALKLVQIDAYPLVVEVAIVNGPLFARADELGRFPELGSAEYPDGGYGLLLGHAAQREEGRWPGHLVTIADRRWLLDFSIDQASRPEHGIKLEPLVIPVTEAFLRGRVAHLVYRYGDVRLYYNARVGDRSYVNTPNWSGDSRPEITLNKVDKSSARR